MGKYFLFNMVIVYVIDFIRNWCELRVEILELIKMDFFKIDFG